MDNMDGRSGRSGRSGTSMTAGGAAGKAARKRMVDGGRSAMKKAKVYARFVVFLAAATACSAQGQNPRPAVYFLDPRAEAYFEGEKKPARPPRAADWAYWASVGAYTAALGADIATTNDVFKRCRNCVEGGNIFLRGKRPTVLNMVAVSVPIWTGIVVYTWWARKELGKENAGWLRHLPLALPLAGAALHGRAAYQNSKIPPDSTQTPE